jgi:hypothetical protein
MKGLGLMNAKRTTSLRQSMQLPYNKESNMMMTTAIDQYNELKQHICSAPQSALNIVNSNSNTISRNLTTLDEIRKLKMK